MIKIPRIPKLKNQLTRHIECLIDNSENDNLNNKKYKKDINCRNDIDKKRIDTELIYIPDLKYSLHSHQYTAVKWMYDIETRIDIELRQFNIRGGILSDAPGLGKTLSTLCLCIYTSIKKPENETGYPNLVICPKIVIDEWCNAITKFFGDTYKYLCLKSDNYKNITIEELKQYKFVITNYEHINSIMNEYYSDVIEENKKCKKISLRKIIKENKLINKKGKELIVDINWNRVICDESHRLNNTNSLSFQSLINVISNRRWCLTGTPIRNYEKDIYHQFLFLGYNNFIGKKRFTYNQYRSDKLYQYILKRSYYDTDIEMPEFEEKYVYIELTKNENEFYKHINECLKKAFKQFSNGYVSFSNILHLFLRLRQMCVSSFAMVRQLNKLKKYKTTFDINDIINDTNDINDFIINDVIENEDWYKEILNTLVPYEFNEWVTDKYGSAGHNSSKITSVVNILENIKNSEKVLIYTCFKTHMDIIKEAIENKINENVLMLNGDYNEHERQEILNIFKNSKNHNIMIINYKLGSEGLNLMESNHVILCENWWCPSVMEQAKHRAYRIGQKKKVFIYNIITKNTIEEQIKKICDKKNYIGKTFMNDVFDTFKQKDYKLNTTTLKKIIF